jgi:peptide deformylase
MLSSQSMAVKKVIRMGHPTLRREAKPLSLEQIQSPWFRELLIDMQETMKAEGGIGIAAPQINESFKVAIINVPAQSERYPEAKESPLLVIVNPSITVIDPTLQGFWEGCLSVPGLRGYVQRPRHVRIDCLDEMGNPRSYEVQDFLAIVFQHELDHLFGTLYIDRLKDNTMLSFTEEFEQFGPSREEIVD